MNLGFIRNKVVDVEPLDGGSLRVSWKLTDTLTEMEALLKLRLPDLEIVDADARFVRYPHGECASAPEVIKKVVGVRIGGGLRKIVRGLIGGEEGCEELTNAVLECCNAVILHFTVPVIHHAESLEHDDKVEAFRDMLRSNPRLVRSCVAFADDSPIMEGLGL